MNEQTRSLRIGYVLNRFPKLQQSFVLNEILALERLGHNVTILSHLHPAPDQACTVPSSSGVPVHYLDSSFPLSLFRAMLWLLLRHPLRMLRTIKYVAMVRQHYFWKMFSYALLVSRKAGTEKIEHLHAHMRRATDVVFLVNMLTGRNYSFTAHTGNVYMKPRFIPHEIAAADFMVTVCDYNKSLLTKLVPDASRKIHVIRPFLDLELYLKADPAHCMDIASRPFRITSVSRLVPIKGINVLLDALNLVIQSGIPVQVTIIGGGPDRSQLEQLINELDLSTNVTLTGAREASFVSKQLCISDCFVLASVRTEDGNSDATPTVLGEAMSLGLPVVSTRIAGIPEIVPADAGYLVEPANPDALAGAIITLATMPRDKRYEMGAHGRKFVHEQWDSEKDAQELAALFANSVDKHATTA